MDGKRLALAIARTGLSQAEAARRAGIKQSALNDIVRGERAIGREDLRGLALALGISADFLLGVRGATVTIGEQRQQSLADALYEHLQIEVANAGLETRPLSPRPSLGWLEPKDSLVLLRRVTDAVLDESRAFAREEQATSAFMQLLVELERAESADPPLSDSSAAALTRTLAELYRRTRTHVDGRLLASPPLTADEQAELRLDNDELAAYRGRNSAQLAAMADIEGEPTDPNIRGRRN